VNDTVKNTFDALKDRLEDPFVFVVAVATIGEVWQSFRIAVRGVVPWLTRPEGRRFGTHGFPRMTMSVTPHVADDR